MFENDSVHAFHQTRPKKPQKMQAMGLPVQSKRDDFIMDTNNSSIVSKRSVEKMYYAGQPEYFRYFVRKFQRRSPLINRGYWLRMKAIDHVVQSFLREDNRKQKVVINLGCGYDPLPFEYLGKHAELCQNAVFIDVDYPQLIERKLDMIRQHDALLELLPGLEVSTDRGVQRAHTAHYKAFGCDLRNLGALDAALRANFDLDSCSVAILFVAEVSVAYMDVEPANALMKWANTLNDARFCLLEQHLPDGPDHPFAQTMLKHFEKLRTPLRAIGTIDGMRNRFTTAGWPRNGIDVRSLWELWSDSSFLTPDERQNLDRVEPFDEWEEFALFGSHYFLLVANNNGDSSTKRLVPSWTERVNLTRPLAAECIEGKPTPRRFAACAVIRSSDRPQVLSCGGMGTRERLNSCDSFVQSAETIPDPSRPLPAAIMCHTLTSSGHDRSKLLLVGGRGSPDKASKACWLLADGTWKAVDSLPEGRYRHCAVAVDAYKDDSQDSSGVLIGLGRQSNGHVLGSWLLWTAKRGWSEVTIAGGLQGEPDARFGAAMAASPGKTDEGVLLGGMRMDGTICDDCWSWKLEAGQDPPILTFSPTELARDVQTVVGRFGASLLPSAGGNGLLLIGGVTGGKMLDRMNEIFDLDTAQGVNVEYTDRPLLVGCSIVAASKSVESAEATQILVLGGGATCFSFGTFWNKSCVLTLRGKKARNAWRVSDPTTIPRPETNDSNHPPLAENGGSETTVAEPKSHMAISRVTMNEASDFDAIRRESQPVIISGLDIGTCTQKWTVDYLKDKIGADRRVVMHDSPTSQMDFLSKNFSYTTRPFGEFLESASNGSHVYLRALSSERPAERATNLADDFASIADDFCLPGSLKYVTNNAHSSPLRISGPVTMWLHYDVMANVLCQIQGKKRLLLFPPSDVTKLGFAAGASSSSINAFDRASVPSSVHAHEAILESGDVLFIPPLWLHTAEPTEGLSIAVNVFFRDDTMENAYAAGKDVYGNRDLAAYERGRRDVQRIGKSFEGLSEQVRTFYISRLAQELQALI